MRNIGLHEIRKEFLEYFEEKNHLVLPSFSLVPKDDKSLLLIGAGMAPLKKYYTGEATPENSRMATSQKCIRTGDIENVGITDRHATFFEMLGNFSFADYFKEEAIQWAWEFLTENLQISEDKLWATVYKEDDEAKDLWIDMIGMDPDKVIKLGKKDNFWELEVGPSGPCSEIYFDRGENVGCGESTCAPGCECDRFLEVWNLVFTQYDKDSKGNYNLLPNPNIDTGMGLERIAAVLEGVDSIFEIEAIREILEEVEKITDKNYGKDESNDISIRIITDHSRAITFLVSDGVVPSNEGRGYVLRRLIRRASRHGKLLGVNRTFLGEIIDKVIGSWKVEYKEIEEKKDKIKKIVKIEEERFQKTIDQGLEILEEYMEEMRESKLNILDGEKAFKLYDTYGFPLDLTREILEEKELEVDEKGFEEHMEHQRLMARSARDSGEAGWSSDENVRIYKDLDSEFKGYDFIKMDSKVIGLFTDEEEIEKLGLGEKGILILDKTPFYAEGGGQVGDMGIIKSSTGKAKVIDTQSTSKDHILHIVKITDGYIQLEDQVESQIDSNRREFIKRNHTATHILHRALKDVLGEEVNQAGSVVERDRLRFDFTFHEPVGKERLKQIENIVNSKIFDSIEVTTSEMSIDEAKDMGVVGLFDAKYGELVRVLSIGEYSKELCGGTHVDNTSEIGIFKIISESSTAAGVRRIEAISSIGVYNYIRNVEDTFDNLVNMVKANKNNIVDRINSILIDNEEKDRELNQLRSKMASSLTDDLLESKETLNGIDFIAEKIDNMDMSSLRELGDDLKSRIDSGLIVLAGIKDDKLYFVVTATKDLVSKGIHSGNIIREVARVTGGSGGGRPDMAQAGGKDINKVEESFQLARELFKEKIE